MPREFVPALKKRNQEDIPKAFFLNALYERSNKKLPWLSVLYLTFYQRKFSESAMLKHFVWSINKIYQ